VAGWDDTLGYQLYKTDPSGREEGEGGGEGGRDGEESSEGVAESFLAYSRFLHFLLSS